MVKIAGIRRRWRGYVMMDTLAALALLGMGIFVAVVFFRAEVREIRYSHDRLAALLIAQSEIERLHTIPFDRIAVGEGQSLNLALPSAKRVKDCAGRLTIDRIEPGLKRATVRIDWRSARGLPLHVTASSVFSKEAQP